MKPLSEKIYLCFLSALLLLAGALEHPFLCRKKEGEKILCVWEEGTSMESLSFVFSSICGIEERGISLKAGDRSGFVPAGKDFFAAKEALSSVDPLSLFSLNAKLPSIEKCALFRAYRKTGYYSEELYCFDGESLKREMRSSLQTIVLLSGDLPEGFLKSVGAKNLSIGEYAFPTPSAIFESEIEFIQAKEPYFERGGALYKRENGALRLIFALPLKEELELSFQSAERGALKGCRSLKRLRLPQSADLELLFDGEIPKGLELI